MGLLNTYRDWIVSQMSGFDYVGLGDGTTAEDQTQTGLQGSNTHYEQADSGYPSISGNTLTTRITVASADAQFAWEEVVICDGTPGQVANRDVIPFGTKGNVEWELELEFTLELA